MGFEPTALFLAETRSIHLSYGGGRILLTVIWVCQRYNPDNLVAYAGLPAPPLDSQSQESPQHPCGSLTERTAPT